MLLQSILPAQHGPGIPRGKEQEEEMRIAKMFGSPSNLVQDELGSVLNGLQEIVALSCPKSTERSPGVRRFLCRPRGGKLSITASGLY